MEMLTMMMKLHMEKERETRTQAAHCSLDQGFL